MIDIKILAYALSEKRLLLDLQSSVTTDYFDKEHKPFYKLLLSCFSKFNEIPTPAVMSEQGKASYTEAMDAIYSEALSLEIDTREFPSDLEKLRERYNIHLLHKSGQKVFNDNWDGENFKDLKSANLEIKKLSVSLDGVYNKKVFKEGPLSGTIEEAWNEYRQIKKNPDLAKGIHLGLREFDRITNGLQKSELMFVGGESSAGKSALSMNMGINAWLGKNKVPLDTKEEIKFNDSGANILYFSIEMPFKAMRRRIDANLAGIPLYGIRDGQLTPEEEERFKAVLKFQKAYSKQFHIIDVPRGCTMAQIEAKYVDICNDYTPDLIIIDYITLMSLENEPEGGDWLSIGKLAEQMHEFCRTYETRIISPVQLTKPPKTNGKETATADQHRIGRSIMIAQNANIVLNIETRKDEESRPDMIVRIAKMRDGEKGAFVLHKALSMMRIYDDLPEWTPEDYSQ
jgi:replicative DNA helicase